MDHFLTLEETNVKVSLVNTPTDASQAKSRVATYSCLVDLMVSKIIF